MKKTKKIFYLFFLSCLMVVPQGWIEDTVSTCVPFYTFGRLSRFLIAEENLAEKMFWMKYFMTWEMILLRGVNFVFTIIIFGMFVLSIIGLFREKYNKILSMKRLYMVIFIVAGLRIILSVIGKIHLFYKYMIYYSVSWYIFQFLLIYIYSRFELKKQNERDDISTKRIVCVLLIFLLLLGSGNADYGQQVRIRSLTDSEDCYILDTYNIFQENEYDSFYSIYEEYLINNIQTEGNRYVTTTSSYSEYFDVVVFILIVLGILGTLSMLLSRILKKIPALAFAIHKVVICISVVLYGFTMIYCLFSTIIWQEDRLMLINRVFSPGIWIMCLLTLCGYLFLNSEVNPLTHSAPVKKRSKHGTE